jgi:uncharacterized membrane protein YdbT with pleckstrin-like domain
MTPGPVAELWRLQNMSYIEKSLLSGENVVYRARLHWILYGTTIFVAVLALVAFGIALYAENPIIAYVGGGLLLIALLAGIAAYIKRSSAEFAVTNHRVIIKVGIISRRTVELLLQQVEGVGVEQSFWGRLLNYGVIKVSGTGETHEVFRRISRPLEFRRNVQAQTVLLMDQKTGVAAQAPTSPAQGPFCGQCGAANTAGARFCSSCGKALAK